MKKEKIKELITWVLLISFFNWIIYPGLTKSGRLFASEYSVMIIPASGGSEMPEEFIEMLSKAFKDTGRFDVISRKEVKRFIQSRQGGEDRDYGKVFKEASDLLSEGEKFYNALKVDEAITVLQEAKLKFKEALPSIRSESEYSRFLGSFFYLCMAYQAKGLNEQARSELKEMVILDPKRKNRKFSKKYYPPSVLKLHAQVKAQVLKGQNGKIKIKSTPPGANVYLDGASAGDTPSTVNNLPVGEHFVTIEKEGFLIWADSKFLIEGENTIEVDLEPKAGQGGSQTFKPVKTSYDIPRDVGTVLDEMGVSLGADIFLLWEFSRKGKKAKLTGQLYDQRNQEVSGQETVSISDIKNADEVASFAGKLAGFINEEGYVVSKGTAVADNGLSGPDNSLVEPTPDVEDNDVFVPDKSKDKTDRWGTLPSKRPGQSKRWYEKGWVWGVIIGSVAVTAGSVLIFTDVAKAPASRSNFVIGR